MFGGRGGGGEGRNILASRSSICRVEVFRNGVSVLFAFQSNLVFIQLGIAFYNFLNMYKLN